MFDQPAVTFGGGQIERAAHLRNQPAELTRMREAGATILPLWRGKPFFAQTRGDETGQAQLGWVSAAAEGLQDIPASDMLFLGFDGESPRFACDLSEWVPEEGLPETLGAFMDPSEQTHPRLPPHMRFAELRAQMTLLSPNEAELAAIARGLIAWHQSHGFCAKCGAASDIAMAGWQRDCPSCGANHYPRTDPVVIMLITHGNSVLLGRAPNWPERMYSLLAGFMEPGETIEAAVRREVVEESGIRVGQVEYLCGQPWPFPASLMLACRGQALSRELKIDEQEIENALWITREELLSVFRNEHPQVAPPRHGAVARYVLERWMSDLDPL
ncbi:MAG: NAD(+) diphosphatase [Mangrovicoccus sp.]